MTITVLPSPPQRTDSGSVFATKGDAFIAALPQFVTEANTLAATLQANLLASSLGVTATSATSLTIATGAQNLTVEAGKGFVVGMALKVTDAADIANYMVGTVTAYDGTTGALALTVTSVGGSGTLAAWTVAYSVPAVTGPSLPLSSRTSNTILSTIDASKLIDITSGTFTQTFAAAATLGAGWYCYIRNSGTGDITLDPDASELIDGLTSYIMYPGEVRLLQCDGAALLSVVLNAFSRTYAASDTFINPPGYRRYGVELWGGGASGQRTNSATTLSKGGGGGACAKCDIAAPTPGSSDAIVIAAGGAAVTTVANGNAGGNSTAFGITACLANTTGVGGYAFTTKANDAYSPISALNAAGAFLGGGNGSPGATDTGAPSVWGGGGGGGLTTAAALLGAGTSIFAGNGGAAVSAGNGVAGAIPGGGGGATQTGTQSGAGGRGELRVWGII